MSDDTDNTSNTDAPDSGNLAYEQAQLAYTIIQSLLEHTRVTSDLIALMAQVIDEDTTKALTATHTGRPISTAAARWSARAPTSKSLRKLDPTRRIRDTNRDTCEQLTYLLSKAHPA